MNSKHDKRTAEHSGSKPTGSYPESVQRLIQQFQTLPGVGRRSAERLAFHIMKQPKQAASSLAHAIADVRESVTPCRVCFNFAEGDLCAVCSDPTRDASKVVVVEEPKDVIAIEQAGIYRGTYHVLLGRISPLDGIGPSDLTIPALLDRVTNPEANPRSTPIQEVILALNPTLEGDGTALYLTQELKKRRIRTSKLARGLPSGTHLALASKAVIADAIADRTSIETD